MRIADDGPYVPALPADAGPKETELHRIYGFLSPTVRMTAEDWGKTADAVSGLAAEVRAVVAALRGADEPWEGPAAQSAYATLGTLAVALDNRAAEIADIKKGLEDAAAAADTARTSYTLTVRSVSTAVDPDRYRPEGGGAVNVTAYEAAVEARREEREAAAGAVLDTFTSDMGSAAKQLPVEQPRDTVRIDATPAGGGGTPGGGYPSGGSGGGTYLGPAGPGGGGGSVLVPVPADDGPHVGTGITPAPTLDPAVPDAGVGLDGPTTGTTSPTGGGSTGWAGTVGGGTGPGTGGGSTAAGAGGLLAGGAAMLGRGMAGRGMAGGAVTGRGGALGAAGRPGPLVAGAAAGRGSGTAGRGSGTAGRGSGASGARTGGTGAAGGGRGVVAAGTASGGRGAVGAGSAAGGRGRGAKDRDRPADEEILTHEDEETWFEGEDDATPPVWR